MLLNPDLGALRRFMKEENALGLVFSMTFVRCDTYVSFSGRLTDSPREAHLVNPQTKFQLYQQGMIPTYL